MDKPYWVEAKRAVTDRSRVIAYEVRTDLSNPINASDDGRSKLVHRFRIAGKQTADIALHLANLTRDDLNAGIP